MEGRVAMGVARQVRDEAVAPREAVAALVLRGELDLHARHVDARRALALATLAGDAQLERFAHRFAREVLALDLAGEREPQGVGAPAREVALGARGAIARAHGAGVELAAVAIVVAHLDGAGEPAPLAPVERRRRGLRRVAGAIAEERAVVLARRVHDLARVHQALRVEPALDLREARREARPEERRDPFGAHQAVAVLARIAALVAPDQVRGFLGDRAHAHRAVALHVQDRAHVQAADGGMGVPRALGAVLAEDVGEV
jgi:hypothetical protein